MNLTNIFQSKKLLLFLLIILVIVFSIFMMLLFQKGYIGGSQSLSDDDQTKISSVVKKSLSDTFTPDELKLTNFKGDHKWSIALLYSTNETIDPGFVLMKNDGNEWKLVYGPVTDPDPEALKKLGAPQALIGQIDDVFVPPGIPQ
jgi:hypothetical protein